MELRKIEWNKLYEIGDAKVDSEHKNLCAMFNELYEASKNESLSESDVSAVFSRLISISRENFISEEELMRECGYPHLDAHVNLHATLIRDIQELACRYASNRFAMSAVVFIYLRSWLLDHIQGYDYKFAKWLKSRNS